MNIYAGIDPGLTGAIAFFYENGDFIEVFDMPTMALGKKNQVNAIELTKILNKHVPKNVFIEMVGAMPGQGVSSMFNFGMGYGVLQGVCAGLFLPITLITPNKWKKMAGLIGKEKDQARTLAQQTYPAADLSLKKHVGRADAMLIAAFGIIINKVGC